LDLLNSSNDFSFDEVSAISEAREIVRISHDYDAELLRAVNTVRHILLSETGQSQADWDFLDVSNQLDSRKRIVFEGMSVYLEDVRSPFNVGSMFRIAESFGVEKIMLSPLTADPLHKRAERTAMGCISAVPWERTSWEHFSEANSVFALETGGIPLKDFPFPKSGIMIVGSEELGVSPKALVCADASLGRVSIPLYGAKGSLNVSSAFAIATQAWAERLIYG
jgi:TrmH family RNA methyltransferase